jgi:hypothetical protein
MSKYADKTDREINHKVDSRLNGESHKTRVLKDYCNNPTDAWPIIVEKRIEIHPRDIRVSRNEYIKGWGALPESCSESYEIFSKGENPLRCAMEVYLMMEDEA